MHIYIHTYIYVYIYVCITEGFLGGEVVKICLPVQETQLPSLGQKDTLEKEMATHSSVLAWRIPGTEEPGRRPSMWSHRVGHD